jgi:hypothetical protein
MKKNTFSILELIVGLFLISLLIGVLSSSLQSGLRRIQFEKDTHSFQGFIQMAYDLVLHYDVDISLHLSYKNETLKAQLKSDFFPLLKEKDRIKYFKSFKKVQLISQSDSLNIQSLSPSSKVNEGISLFFSYYGGRMSPSKMEILGDKKNHASFLINGFPHVIRKEK